MVSRAGSYSCGQVCAQLNVNCLSADADKLCSLPSWLFGLKQPNTGAYRPFGVDNGDLMEASCCSTSENCYYQCPCLHGEP